TLLAYIGHQQYGERFAVLWTALLLGAAVSTGTAQAAPFAYVTNSEDGTVSVIDTATDRLRPTSRVCVGVDGRHSRRSEAEPERAFGTRGTVDAVAPVAGFMTSSGKPGGSVGVWSKCLQGKTCTTGASGMIAQSVAEILAD